jgi:SAM-dependent methyltransferase
MSYKTITKESYQATAEAYTSKVSHLAPIESIEKFIALLPLNAKIIDIGCGSGRDAKIFSEHGLQVCGIDFSPNLIEIAKKQAPCAEFHVMDIEEMTFPSLSFDGAWAGASLLHLPKKIFPGVLRKIYSLLKANGYLYLTVKKGLGEELKIDERYGDFKKFWSFYEEKELKTFLQEANFKILDLAIVEKNDSYLTGSSLRAFCQKA